MAELDWRALVLVSATACTLTAASIFLFLSRSDRFEYRRRSVSSSSSSARDAHPTKRVATTSTSKMTQHETVTYLNNAGACFDYTVGKHDSDEFEDVKVVVKEICPDWRQATDSEIAVKIIVGGITNRLYRLIWQDKSVLIRLYGDNTEAFIDRTVENKLFAMLSERGFAPTYHGRFSNGRVEGWLDARPLEPEEMGQTQPVNFLGMIGKELGVMHSMDIPDDRSPVLWQKIDRFAKLACETAMPDPAKTAALEKMDLSALLQKLQWLKSVLPSSLNGNGSALVAAMPVDEITKQANVYAGEVVFCHNDALSGNLLHNPEWDRVQIIDYEYGGYNFRAFDFANHFCENCGFEFDLNMYPDIEHQFNFFKSYMATASPELLATLEANRESKAFFHALYDAVNRYALASHLFWGFWAVVQAGHSKIDFDFLEYAGKRFAAFDQQKSYFFG